MDQALEKQVAPWLLACCALMFAMVGASGVTRLTHSGLFMVEWQPLTGTFPPLMGKLAGTTAPLSTLELRRINGTF